MNIEIIESQAQRNALADKIEVLEKVKALTLLPDDMHVTTQMVADYYEVSFKAIRSIIMRHREELESDGMKVLRGQELKEYKDKIQHESFQNVFAHLSIFTRRTVLRIGMLLRDSEVAKKVRSYLLNVEEGARNEAPQLVSKAVTQSFEGEIPKTYIEALEAHLKAEKEKLALQAKLEQTEKEKAIIEAKLEEATPKAHKYEAFMNSDGLFDFDSVSSILNIGRNKLFELLRKKGIMFKHKDKNLAVRTYELRGYFETKVTYKLPDKYGIPTYPVYTTFVTPKGLDWLIEMFGSRSRVAV